MSNKVWFVIDDSLVQNELTSIDFGTQSVKMKNGRCMSFEIKDSAKARLREVYVSSDKKKWFKATEPRFYLTKAFSTQNGVFKNYNVNSDASPITNEEYNAIMETYRKIKGLELDPFKTKEAKTPMTPFVSPQTPPPPNSLSSIINNLIEMEKKNGEGEE